MNRTTSYLKKILLIFGLAYSLVSFATPVTWDLKFWTTQSYGYDIHMPSSYYDYLNGHNSEQIPEPTYPGKESGDGYFTYDPATTACIARSKGGCTPDLSSSSSYVDGFDVNTKIDSIFFEANGIKVGDGTEYPLENLWWDNALGLMSIKDGAVTSVTDVYSDLLDISYPNAEYSDYSISDFSISDFQQDSETSWRASWSEDIDFFDDDSYGPYFAADAHDRGYLVATRINDESCKPAEYISNKGKILISGLKIGNKIYKVMMKKKNGYDFTIKNISRTADDTCQQAEYISNKGRIKIPTLTINNKKYKVVMKKISGKDFRIEQISRIAE